MDFYTSQLLFYTSHLLVYTSHLLVYTSHLLVYTSHLLVYYVTKVPTSVYPGWFLYQKIVSILQDF